MITLAMNYGLSMIDVALSYGDAEVKLNDMLRKYRSRFFLAEKTLKRTKEEASLEMKASLERLGVKNFDLYQFHAVRNLEELEKIMSKDSAIEAFKEAKETGLVKYIGLTGHRDVRVHLKALELFDFDALLLPVCASSLSNPTPENDFRPVLKAAVDRGVGVTAIKAVSRRRWASGASRSYDTWYEPSDVYEEVQMLVNFTLSQDGVSTYSMACDVKLWPLILEAGKNYKHLDVKEQEEIMKRAQSASYSPLYPQ